MAFGRSRNRRRIDAAVRAEAAKGLARRLGTALARVLGAIALSAGLFLGGYGAYRWALTSPSFAVRSITFSGAHRSSEAELSKLAGLARGQNLFQLDTEQMARAMAQEPWVKGVAVRRQLPSTVIVAVTEHVPQALVAMGDLYVVDAQGEPFKKLQPADALDLPLITGIDRDAYVAAPREVSARIREALELLSVYEASPRSLGTLSEVRVGEGGMALVSSSGLVAELGEGPAQEALARLEKVSAELSKRGLSAEVIRLDNRVRPGWVAVSVSSQGIGR